MKTKYPHPILKQVELDHNYEGAKVTGNPQRIGHHQGLRRAYKRKFGSFWNEPDDFRKAFQIMAAEMRLARNKVWYAHPARARRTELQSHSQHGSNSGLDSRAGLGSETESRSQSQSRHQPQQVDIDQIKAILRQGSSEECTEALKAVEQSTIMLLADFEESATSLIAQVDEADDMSDE
ncbi:hypothetical protein Pdw03_1995 [Penicillium digitatum]|uniref:Uncharacterized protein n=1 Tax=Penicillium digitatum TaxID=36651 RepID=A0A7T6XTR3_PENDI|nr:hypothetical protein Pdw03_1995 [Penicillium digitatum]